VLRPTPPPEPTRALAEKCGLTLAALAATVGVAAFATFGAFKDGADPFTRSTLPSVEVGSPGIPAHP
jgi:hypothetical protein